MIIEISPLTVILAGAIGSALIGGAWALARSFLAQYGNMVSAQLAAHREAEAQATAAIAGRIDGIERELEALADDHAQRLNKLEGVIKSAPTHNDLGKLYDRVNATANEVSGIAGELRNVTANLRLILNRITERGLP